MHTSLYNCVRDLLKKKDLFSKYENKFEILDIRYGSFKTFPYNDVFCLQLAQSGFYYLGKSDFVQCYRCNRKIGNWIRPGRIPLDSDKILSNLKSLHLTNNSTCTDENGIFRECIDMPEEGELAELMMPRPSESMKEHSNRVKTFTLIWPKEYPSADSCARAGLYFTSLKIGNLRCAFCNCVVQLSHYSQKPFNEHMRVNPDCPYLSAILTNGGSNEDESAQNFAIAERSYEKLKFNRIPIDVNMSKTSIRLQTFKQPNKWTGKLKPEDLADAGFFFCGENDVVQCFHCGGTLSHWEKCDNPYDEHAIHFPHCDYIRRVIGDTRLQKLQLKKNNATRSEGSHIADAFKIMESLQSKRTSSDHRQEKGAKKGSEEIDDKLCMICYNCERQVVLTPCGHLIGCHSCCKGFTSCPICRADGTFCILSNLDLHFCSYKMYKLYVTLTLSSAILLSHVLRKYCLLIYYFTI
ncbi:hypothetical protein GJ496_008433 [Pomphorhynchus laevis]|nr:hypothetical protein GJ496_008433 [Pomphorhynchus laevis]